LPPTAPASEAADANEPRCHQRHAGRLRSRGHRAANRKRSATRQGANSRRVECDVASGYADGTRRPTNSAMSPAAQFSTTCR